MKEQYDKRSMEILAGQCLNASVQIFNTRTCTKTMEDMTDGDLASIFTLSEKLFKMALLKDWDKVAASIVQQ